MSFANLNDLLSNVSHLDEEIKNINSSIEKIEANFKDSSVGSIYFCTSPIPPKNHLFCDGSSLDRKIYSNLFSVIGTTFGSLDNNSFNLPLIGDSFSDSTEIKYIIRY